MDEWQRSRPNDSQSEYVLCSSLGPLNQALTQICYLQILLKQATWAACTRRGMDLASEAMRGGRSRQCLSNLGEDDLLWEDNCVQLCMHLNLYRSINAWVRLFLNTTLARR